MDPDAALQRMRDAIRVLMRDVTDDVEPPEAVLAATEVIDAWATLDGWFTSGGFLPQDWSTTR